MAKSIRNNILQKDIASEIIPELLEMFHKKSIELPREQAENIAGKVKELQNYQPRVAVFGKTGAGKSSLCNSIFGEDVAPVSDTEACTRAPQEYLLRLSKTNTIVLIDMPGVGESKARDEEYSALYTSLLPHIDLLLWVVKSDDRALSVDEHIWNTCVSTFVSSGCPVFVVINQVDKVNPVREWDVQNNSPGPSQQKLVEEKILALSTAFKVAANQIVPVSALEHYNIVGLVEAIVLALPNEKKLSFLNAVNDDVISDTAQKEAERGFFEAIADYAKKTYEWMKPYIPTILEGLLIVFGKRA